LPLKWLANANIANIVQLFRQITYLKVGNRLIAESGDSKSKRFLFEGISLAIQRGNAASIRGGHFSRFRLIIGNFCIVNQKCYVIMLSIQFLYLALLYSNNFVFYYIFSLYSAFFLTLAIGIYMLKNLGSVNELFSRNFQVKFGRISIRLVFYKSISVWPIVQNKIITELEQKEVY
jgi:hypothetical protein